MNITLIGCGSLGKILLYLLDKNLCSINLVTKNNFHNDFFESIICTINGTIHSCNFVANSSKKLKNSDIILLTLEADNIAEVINNISDRIAPDCPIVIICNGMGMTDQLKGIQQPIIRGITNHAAFTENGITYHKHHGVITLGPGNEAGRNCMIVADKLNALIGSVNWEPTIQNVCWQKLAVNCIVNPLTVKYDCYNGDLINYPEEIINLCEEIYRVIKEFTLFDGVDSLVDHVLAVIDATAKNSSSMRQDISNKKKTEIEYINGFILRQASQLNIALPLNDALYKLVIEKEQEYLTKKIQ